MFNISVVPINEDSKINVSATDWQLAIDSSFDADKIIIDDENNTEELFNKVFDIVLRPTDIYYVRYRFRYTDGTEGEWSKPILVTYNSKGFSLGSIVIATPNVKLNVNPNEVPVTGFTIETDPFVVLLGNTDYKSTDWEIEDMNGNIVWSYKNDIRGSNSLTVSDVVLNTGKVYLIKVKHNSKANISSNYGKLYIKTAGTDLSSDMVPANDVITMLASTYIYASLK